MAKKQQAVDVSVVVPVYNEEACLPALVARVSDVLTALGRGYELVCVDDGSSDRSLEVLLGLRAERPWLRVVKLVRNFGQTPALYAGFAQSRGAFVVMLDADLQNPPEEIPKLLAKLEEGYDVVSGWRRTRHDDPLRVIPSRLINRFFAWVTQSPVHDFGCSLKALRRETVDRLVASTHCNRYVSAEIAKLNPRMAEVEVAHSPRTQGQSKYGFAKLYQVTFDLLTTLSTAPVRVVAAAGLALGLLGLAGLAGGAALYALWRPLEGGLVMLAGVASALSGVQLGALGVLGEYITRIFAETQQRPLYEVEEVYE